MADEQNGSPAPGQLQPGVQIPEKFLRPDGSTDFMKMAESYLNLEQEKGRLGNELGHAKETLGQWNAWGQSNLVQVDGKVYTREAYEELQKHAQNKPAPNPQNPDELNDMILDTWTRDPKSVLAAVGEQAKREAMNEYARREKVMTSPHVQKVFEQYPDVRDEVFKLADTGLPYEEAVERAVGRKVMQLSTGQPSNPAPPSTLPNTPPQIPGLDNLFSVTRTFMQPDGRSAGTQEKPRFSEEQYAAAARNGVSRERLDRSVKHKDKNNERRYDSGCCKTRCRRDTRR